MLSPFLPGDSAAVLGMKYMYPDYSPSGYALDHRLNEGFSVRKAVFTAKAKKDYAFIVIVYLRICMLTNFLTASHYAFKQLLYPQCDGKTIDFEVR